MKVNPLKWAVWSENEYSKPRVLAYFSRENDALEFAISIKSRVISPAFFIVLDLVV